jgi:hypothetical protein
VPDDNFGLADEEFWSGPLKPIEGPLPTEGLSIAAPGVVPLERRETLPVVARRSTTLKESMVADFKRLALLHAVDVDANRLFTGFALDRDNAIFRDPDPALLARVAPARTLEPFLLEARARLDIPWRRSVLLLTATLRDKVSNRRRVELGAGTSSYRDPAVAEFLESQRGRKPPPDPWPAPGDPLPSYRPMEGSPALPEKAGIAISGDRVTILEPGSGCVIRGSFRVPALKQDLVPPDLRLEHRALVAVHLVLTGADEPAPIAVSLRVPIYGEVEPGTLAAGRFAFDLLSLVSLPEQTQTYFLYAFSREVMAGPSPFAVVTPAMLPPGAR